MFKKEIRILGIDDGFFTKFKKGNVLIVGVVFRGGSFMDGILSTKAAVDGTDATSEIISMISHSKFRTQLKVILLNGIAVGGFNVIDVKQLHKETRIPVMVVIRRYPDFGKIRETLVKLGKEDRYKLIQKAGTVHKLGKVFVQLSGLSLKEAKAILDITCTRAFVPEPLRVAHLIASGMILGESRGSA